MKHYVFCIVIVILLLVSALCVYADAGETSGLGLIFDGMDYGNPGDFHSSTGVLFYQAGEASYWKVDGRNAKNYTIYFHLSNSLVAERFEFRLRWYGNSIDASGVATHFFDNVYIKTAASSSWIQTRSIASPAGDFNFLYTAPGSGATLTDIRIDISTVSATPINLFFQIGYSGTSYDLPGIATDIVNNTVVLEDIRNLLTDDRSFSGGGSHFGPADIDDDLEYPVWDYNIPNVANNVFGFSVFLGAVYTMLMANSVFAYVLSFITVMAISFFVIKKLVR